MLPHNLAWSTDWTTGLPPPEVTLIWPPLCPEPVQQASKICSKKSDGLRYQASGLRLDEFRLHRRAGDNADLASLLAYNSSNFLLWWSLERLSAILLASEETHLQNHLLKSAIPYWLGRQDGYR